MSNKEHLAKILRMFAESVSGVARSLDPADFVGWTREDLVLLGETRDSLRYAVRKMNRLLDVLPAADPRPPTSGS